MLAAVPAYPEAAPAAAASTTLAPRFSLPTGAATVCLDSLRGKLVYVDFWASWCEPCRRSFPWMGTLQDRYKSKGLVVVAISLDKDRAAAEAFLQEHPAPFLVAFDPSGKTAEAFHVATMPSSYLIGPTGNLLYSHSGFDPKKTSPIEAAIKEACSQ